MKIGQRCFCGSFQGDLHEFLVAHSPTCDTSVSGSDDETISNLEQSDFLYIATQIAAGWFR